MPKLTPEQRKAHVERFYRCRRNGRKVHSATGQRHKMHKMKTELGGVHQWARWQAGAKKVYDSIVHRYGREVGFKTAHMGETAQDDQRMRASQRRKNLFMYRPLSSDGRCGAQSMFECYVLEHHSADPYSLFLGLLKGELSGPETGIEEVSPFQDTRELQAPSEQLLLSWVQHLHDGDDDMTAHAGGTDNPVSALIGRQNKGSTIENKLKNLSGVMTEFGQPRIVRSGTLKEMIKDWKNEDQNCPADVFDMETIMPLLYEAIFASDELPNWNLEKRVETWARLLVQMSVIGRGSDVTGEYCPLNDSVHFPTAESGYFRDGSPKWIGVSFTNWKKRQADKVGQPYIIRICANPKDTRFCPVHWLMEHWSLRKAKHAAADMPILSPLQARTWQQRVAKIFAVVGLYCTSHSLRRTAAQWAARCGAPMYIVKNVGRWATIKCMLGYIAEGAHLRTLAIRDHRRESLPDFWPFNADSMVSTIEMTAGQEQLY